jgi:hypothetical protein
MTNSVFAKAKNSFLGMNKRRRATLATVPLAAGALLLAAAAAPSAFSGYRDADEKPVSFQAEGFGLEVTDTTMAQLNVTPGQSSTTEVPWTYTGSNAPAGSTNAHVALSLDLFSDPTLQNGRIWSGDVNVTVLDGETEVFDGSLFDLNNSYIGLDRQVAKGDTGVFTVAIETPRGTEWPNTGFDASGRYTVSAAQVFDDNTSELREGAVFDEHTPAGDNSEAVGAWVNTNKSTSYTEHQ